MCPGATRNQIINHFKKDIEKNTWEQMKKGIITHWYFKVGDQPGVVAILDCESIEEARHMVNESQAVKTGIVEFDIDPVERFPHFD
jgi:hypothetical protein